MSIKLPSLHRKNETVAIVIVLFVAFVFRLYSAFNMGWLAEDVFFIDYINVWFKDHFLEYFFQFNHHKFPPRSPEFGTPPLALWLQSFGMFIGEMFGLNNLMSARLIVILFSEISIYITYKITRNFINFRSAIIASLFVALTPSIIAIDSSAHVDSILSTFLIIGLYNIFYYRKYGDERRLYVAALFFGFAALVKVYAWVIFSTMVLYLFYVYWKCYKRNIFSFLREKKYQKFILIVILIPPVLWAGYRDPDHISRTLHVVLGIGSLGSGVGTGGMFSEYYGVEGYNNKPIYYNFIMIFGRMMPLVSIMAICSISLLFSKKTLPEKREVYILLWLIIITFFLAIHFLGGPKSVFNRILFPSIIFIILASIFIDYLLDIKKNFFFSTIFLLGVVISSVYIPIHTDPHFYNAYNNILVGQTKGASQLYRVGHGEGLDEAAKWINNNSKIGSLIYSPRAGFIDKYLENRYLSYASLNQGLLYAISQGADYIVLHNTFFSGGLNPRINADLSHDSPVHTVDFQNSQYIRIFQIDAERYFNILQTDFNLIPNKIGLKDRSSVMKVSSEDFATDVRYSFNKNEYVFVQYSLNIVEPIDGIYVEITSDGNESNMYIDIGQDGVGYYRHTLKNKWVGKQEFYIPFDIMTLNYSPFELSKSDYLKVSLDSYKSEKTGSLKIENIAFIKYK